MKFKLHPGSSRLIEIRLPFAVYRLPDKATVGVTNRTPDGYYCLFLDYDSAERDAVADDARFFQRNYDVGAMLLLCSSGEEEMATGKMVGNYHLVGFTKFTFPAVRELIGLSRCDSHFRVGYRYQQRCWVLRIGQKLDNDGAEIKSSPELCSVLESTSKLEASLGMIELYEKLYNIRLKAHFRRIDSVPGVDLIDYAT